MERHHWKRASFVVIRGLLLIFIATILQSGGYFDRFEVLLYDERVRHCQLRPPPEPSLVQLDVDENALSYIGRWPWDPSKMARVMNELALAKPKVVQIDVLFAEKRGIEFGQNDPVGFDADAELAMAISNLGCAVVPVSVKFDDVSPPSKLRQNMLPLLIDNPELTEAECDSILRSKGLSDKPDVGSTDSYLQIREQAYYERIWNEIKASNYASPDKERIMHAMLPHADPQVTGTVLQHLFDAEFEIVLREKAILPFTLPVTEGLPPLIHPKSGIAPILPIALAAAHSGFCDYLPEDIEGTVRSIPLLVQYRDRIVPQTDLVTACVMLGADIHKVRLTATKLTIPVPGKEDVVIPVSVRDSKQLGSVGAVMEIPLFGNRDDWLTMYDPPKYQKQAQHMSVYEVWQICETIDKLKLNQKAEDRELGTALDLTDPDAETAYLAAPPVGEAKRQLVNKALENTSEFVKNLGSETDLDPNTKQLLQKIKAVDADLRLILAQNDKLQSQLQQLRSSLHDKLHGKAVFFGGTATGLLDNRPTSLFSICPGIVIHGAIYNAIMTGKMWEMTPRGLGGTLTAVVGVITLAIVIYFSPALAFAGSVLLAVGYIIFNGYYLFAHEDLVVNLAGPLVAVALVWSGMTLTSFLTEIAERARITRRFQNYVDPHLVKYMVDHPEHQGFDGETREITCCFSDLAGFTTLTDQIGPGIVKLLSEYMGEMIPVIRKYNGYVSQMAGDGIYFFFGAPVENPDHALDAINVTFGMYAALDQFNVALKNRGLSQLGMRIGITTGEVIVGDTGPSDSCAYTAMGATVNLASRLEGANKVFGSRMLMTARTAELLKGKYLIRPIANLRVVGKLNCELMYEPLCPMANATEADHQLVAHTTKVFDAYRAGDFKACVAASEEMANALGESKFTKLYTSRANKHLSDCITIAEWEGEIVLTEK